MIESSFLCSSAWDSDVFQGFGTLPTFPSINFEDPTYDIDDVSIELSCCSTPIDTSSSSSDYDGFLLDDLDILSVSDTFVSEILDDNANTVGPIDQDWLSVKESANLCSPAVNNSSYPTGDSLKNPFEYLLSTKFWSKMSSEEQLETLHALSNIVTYHMGIREQMEVIKIIDPAAVIAPDDKEFVLDSTHLSDLKLRRIKDFIKKLKLQIQNTSKSRTNFSSIEASKKSNSAKFLSRKTNCLNYSRTKRKQKKKVIEETEENRKRQKQTKKERKSGFFVYEKKMKLVNPLEEDEDVNILE